MATYTDLPMSDSSSFMVQLRRKDFPRWNERYQSDEIDVIFQAVCGEFTPQGTLVANNMLLATPNMHKVMEILVEELGRPVNGLLNKMFKLNLLKLTKQRVYYRGPKRFEFNTEYIASIKGGDGCLRY